MQSVLEQSDMYEDKRENSPQKNADPYSETKAGYILAIVPGISIFAPAIGPFLGNHRRQFRCQLLSFIFLTSCHAAVGVNALNGSMEPWLPFW